MEKGFTKNNEVFALPSGYHSDESETSSDPQSPVSDVQINEKNNLQRDGLEGYDFTRRAADAASLKVKRLRANDRERRRVNLINSAMEMLRKVIPELRERRKITKLELLRCANRYIWTLQQSLLTGRTMVEVQEAFSYYQCTRSFPANAFYSYEFGIGNPIANQLSQ